MNKTLGWLTFCGLAVLYLIVFITYAPGNSAEWAAWVQAFGSIGAIAGVIWVANRQNKQALEREASQRSGRKREIEETIRSIIGRSDSLIHAIPGVDAKPEDMDMYIRFLPRAHFQNLEKLLRMAPLYDVGKHVIVDCSLDMLEVLDRTERIFDAVAQLSHEKRQSEWQYVASIVSDIQYSSRSIVERLDAAKNAEKNAEKNAS